MLDLSKQQMQDILNTKATAENGINELLEMTINAIMYCERKEHLRLKNNPKNKANGYRPIKAQGYGKLLQLAIPRDRLGTFKPIFMATLEDEQKNFNNMCFELYREGLTVRRTSKLLQRVFGAKYSRTSISNMNKNFYKILQEWRERQLDKRYPIVFVDAIHTKVKREKVQGEAFYVALAVREDLTREVILIDNNPTESAKGWDEMFDKIKQRGVEEIDLVVADGIAGLEDKVLKHFPKTAFQKCVAHFKDNLLGKIHNDHREEMKLHLNQLFNIADNTYTKEKAYKLTEKLGEHWKKKYPSMKNIFSKEAMRPYFTCLDFNFKTRTMLYTTNWIERLNKEFRRALKIRNSMPSIDSVLFLLSAIAKDMGEGTYSYPVTSLRAEPKFGSQDLTLLYHE